MKLIRKRLNGYNQSTHHHNPGSGVIRTQGNNNTLCKGFVLFTAAAYSLQQIPKHRSQVPEINRGDILTVSTTYFITIFPMILETFTSMLKSVQQAFVPLHPDSSFEETYMQQVNATALQQWHPTAELRATLFSEPQVQSSSSPLSSRKEDKQ